MNGKTVAIINGKRAEAGEQVELLVDGAAIRLQVARIEKTRSSSRFLHWRMNSCFETDL
jgi:hypothetical protein